MDTSIASFYVYNYYVYIERKVEGSVLYSIIITIMHTMVVPAPNLIAQVVLYISLLLP